jgi:PAS domain S-box-containing protein
MGAAHLVLVISLIPTLIAYKRVARYAQERDRERLQQYVQRSQQTIERRFQRHLDAIHHLTGLLSTPGVTEEHWRRYFSNATFFQDYGALRTLVHYQATTPFPETNAITSITIPGIALSFAPLSRALAPRAFGSQPRSDQELTDLVVRATRRSTTAISELHPIAPRNGTNELTGLTLVSPIRTRGDTTNASTSLNGFIVASLEPEMLIESPFSQTPPPLSVSLSPEHPLGTPSSVGPLTSRLDIGNQTFSLDYDILPAFYTASVRGLPAYVLFGGLVINLMLYLIAWIQAKARLRAEALTSDLRAVQDRDRMLERATNDAIWDWDIPANKLVWNEAVQAMFRYSSHQMSGSFEWWQERLHPDDRRRVCNGREMAVQTGGEFWADEYRFRRGDGTYASVIDRGYIMHDRLGLAFRMIGSMVDITQQKEAEEARQESERKLALHVQQTPLAVIEWDLDFKVTAWNPAAERIFSYSATEAIGKSGASLIVHDPGQNPNPFLFSNILAGESFPDDIRRKFNETWQEVLNQAATETTGGSRLLSRSINAFAVVNRTRTGESIICDWYNTPLVDASGKVVGIASLVLDVSARKEAENALAEEKERLAVTLRSIGDGVIATDTEGRINLINKLAEELTGWSQDRSMGQPLSKVFNVIDQKTRASFRNPLSHVLSSGEIVDLPDSSILVSRAGTEKIIGASAAPIHDQESKIVGSVLVFRDITDEQNIVQERLRSSKLDSLGILAGGIAHDFNNILTAVIGNISFARMFAEPGDKQADRLEEAEKAALRAKDLSTQLLTFSKGGTPVRQTASLPEIIEDSTSFALRGSNVRCEFDMAPELHTVEVDQGQISQVINNLIINAVQAMPAGGIVRVQAENVTLNADSNIALPFGDYARITVQDQGKGIAPDDINHIFDPYFTTKEKGTGLGLATSYSIVKHHDGVISVDSDPATGTAFHIYLPASGKEVTRNETVPDEPLDGHGRILVMDDEEIIRELAITSLEFLGYTVDAVEDGESCISNYQAARDRGEPYDIVIMDLTIPGGMGGVEAIKSLRDLDPEVNAIVSSGYSSGPVMANYEQHGFKGVVAKPYKIEDLAKALATLMAASGKKSSSAPKA